MLIWVYRDWILQGVVPQFTAFEWTRRFTAPGEFVLTVPFTKELFDLLQIGSVLYHKENREAAFIEEVNVVTSKDSSRTLHARGRSVSSLLDRRVVSYTGSGTLRGVIETLLQQNFISPTNPRRRIPNLVIAPYTIRSTSTSVTLEQENFLDTVSRLLLSHDLGLKLDYSVADQTYGFSLYEGRESGAIFSAEYKNLLEQDFYRSTQRYRNTVLIETFIYGDENEGLARREIRTMHTDENALSASETARLFLLDFRATETFDAVMNPQSKQFEYKIDWDLGDIVSCRNADYGVDITKNILEVTEYYDRDGQHLTVVFGDYFRSASDRIRGEVKWLNG